MSDIPAQTLNADEFAIGFDDSGNLIGSQIDESQINYAVLGVPTTSTTQNDVGTGVKTFTLDTDNGITVDDPVRIKSLDDPTCWMYGICTTRDTTAYPVKITVLCLRQSALTIRSQNWQIQRTPNFASQFTELLGYSTTSLVFGSDIVLGSTVTVTTDAGKYFDPGSVVSFLDLAGGANYFAVRVKAYVSTSLVGTVVKVGPSATGTVAKWALFQDAPPLPGIPLYSLNGLRVTVNATDSAHDIDISAGSVRDSTDTIDLILPSGMTKQLDAVWAAGTNQGAVVLSDFLDGTVTVAGATLTGTLTHFLTDFVGVIPTDYAAAGGSIAPASVTVPITVTGASPVNSGGVAPTTDTAALVTSVSNISNATYKRGGINTGLFLAIVLARKDSDGSTDIFASSFTNSGVPDLPADYTYFRTIAVVIPSSGTIKIYPQPLAFLGPLADATQWQVVASGSLPTGANTLSITGITKDEVMIMVSGAKFATAGRALLVQPNGDTTTADYAVIEALGGATGTAPSIFNPIGTTQGTTETCNVAIKIEAAQQAIFKPISGGGLLKSSTVKTGSVGVWANATAISSVTLVSSGSGNFTAGTYKVMQRGG